MAVTDISLHCTNDFSLTHFHVSRSTGLSDNTNIGNYKHCNYITANVKEKVQNLTRQLTNN